MKKLVRFVKISAIIICLVCAGAPFASAKHSSSKRPSHGKAAHGRSSRHERGGRGGSRRGRHEKSRRGGKKLERRGRGRHSRHGRYYAARSSYQPPRNEEALKVKEEAPLHVGDEDPQPTNTHYVTTAPAAPAPTPRVNGIPSERV